MRNLFVKAALVLCTTIIFLPATVFATEPQNTEITSAEEGFTDSDPSVSYENDNSLTLDEKEDDSTSTEPPAEDEKTPDKADTDKENPDPDIFTSGDDFGDGSKSNPFHVVIDSDNPEDGDAPQITDPVIDNGGYSGGGGGGNSTSDSSSEKILHKPQVLLEDSNLSGGRLEAGSTTEMSLTFRNKSCSQNVFGLKISISTENKGIEFEKNSFYVQVLAPGEAITLEQMITITENCDPGQAVITFSLDYEDSKATATTGTELLSFQIIQPVRVKLEASDIPSVLYTMDTVEIPVKAMNLGRDKIYNASVSLKADELSSNDTAFLGTIEAGDLSQGSLRIYVKGKTGKCAGQLILTYEDADGKSYEEEIKFDSEIKETHNWWYSIAAVVAVLLISIILILVRKLHKKNILLEEARKAASH
ncbi:hypothetical protein [Blautia wexlerae]|uniref:hypothetical protein n=1 Tax=Blautia wexlerae TaxID=418240 RepID=UPI0034A15894